MSRSRRHSPFIKLAEWTLKPYKQALNRWSRRKTHYLLHIDPFNFVFPVRETYIKWTFWTEGMTNATKEDMRK